MSNSSLVTIKVPAYEGNYTKGRTSRISEITIHHMSGKLTAKRCGELFQAVGRCGSSHYGIGYDGEIGLYVNECDTAWTNSNWESNCRAVTIETSNSQNKYPWAVSDKSLQSLIKLVADIAKRNNLGTLVKGKNLTWHRMYAATDCPGDYLLSKMDYIVAEANKIINGKIPNGSKGEIAGINKNRGTNELIIYKDKATTGTNQWGYEVAVDKNGIAISDPIYKGNTAIPTGGFVVSGHGTAGTWIYGNIKKGYYVKIVNGKVFAEKPKATTTTSKTPPKTVSYKYNGINVNRGTDYLVVYKNKATTGTNQWGYEVPIDKNGIALSNPVYKGNNAIPVGGFVISGHGKASKWIYENIKKGYYVTVNSNGFIYVDKWQHTSNSTKPTNTGTITFQAYANGKWWNEISSANVNNGGSNSYAGVIGVPINAFRAKAQNGNVYIQSHTKGGGWNSKISSANYSNGTSNSYSGILGKPIDAIKVWSDYGHIDFRVHIKGGGWLNWIDSRNCDGTSSMSYAGIIGKEIDAIQMK